MVTIIKKGMNKKEIQLLLLNKDKKKKSLDLRKYSGTIRLSEDPIKIQKQLRYEWE